MLTAHTLMTENSLSSSSSQKVTLYSQNLSWEDIGKRRRNLIRLDPTSKLAPALHTCALAFQLETYRIVWKGLRSFNNNNKHFYNSFSKRRPSLACEHIYQVRCSRKRPAWDSNFALLTSVPHIESQQQ